MSQQKYAVCPACDGRGTSSAYLGAFTSDDMDQMDEDWKDDYRAGRFDRPCDECRGQRVVPACHCGQPIYISNSPVFGPTQMSGCYDHLTEEEQYLLDCYAISRMEQRMGC